jgi:DeoR family fructose operon transcriptional repressor
MTIRRDLDLLDQEGLLKRVRGGAIAANSTATNFLFDRRSHQQVQQKSRIAKFAAQNLVSDNDIIILEGGTTVHMMTRHMEQSNLTVLTNGLKIATDLVTRKDETVVMASGGTVDYSEQIFVGPQAASFFSNFRAHKCFVGADGLTLEDGATEAFLSGNEIKRAMVKCAQEVILLIDSAKIGTSSLVPAIEAAKIDVVVTDKDAPEDVLKGLAANGVKVHIV